MTQQINLSEQAILPVGQSLTLDGNVTFNGTVSGSAGPAGSTGAVQFNNAGAFGADNTHLFWDNTQKFLGIGTNSPGDTLHVVGAGGLGVIVSELADQSTGYVELDGNGQISAANSTQLNQIDLTATIGSRLTLATNDGSNSSAIILVTGGTPANDWILDNEISTNTFKIIKGSSLAATAALSINLSQAVGIGTNSAAASASLDITSTTRGFLLPRMTTTQKNAISSPATGLEVYDTTLNNFSYYNGTSWVPVGAVTSITGTANQIIASSSTGAITLSTPQNIDTNATVNFNVVRTTNSIQVGINGAGSTLALPFQGTVQWEDSTNAHVINLRAPSSVTANYNLFWPNAQATVSGQALTNDGSGNLSWTTVTTAPAGSNTQVQYNNSGAFGASSAFTYNGTNIQIGTGSNFSQLSPTALSILKNAGGSNGFVVDTSGNSEVWDFRVQSGLNVPQKTMHIGTYTNTGGNPGQLVAAGPTILMDTQNILGSGGTIQGGGLFCTTGNFNFASASNIVTGGGITLTCGASPSGTATGGSITLSSGSGGTTAGGSITLTSGASTTADSGGNITLTSATPANGGSIVLSGTGANGTSGSPAHGNIYANYLNASSALISNLWQGASGDMVIKAFADSSTAISIQKTNGTGLITFNTNTNPAKIRTQALLQIEGGADVTFNNTIAFDSNTGNTVSIKAPTGIASPFTLTLPSAQGTTNSILTNDGSGNLNWGTTASIQSYVEYVVGTPSGSYSGSTTVFGLPFNYNTNGASLEVFYNGQQLAYSDDYTETSNSSITTTTALVAGAKIWFRTISGSNIVGPVTLNRENYVVGTPLNNYTGSTTVFNLATGHTYNVGGNALVVTVDGVTQTPGASNDYTETNNMTITFNHTLVNGQHVSFIWSSTASAGGTVNSGSTGQIPYYTASGTIVGPTSAVTTDGTNITSMALKTNTYIANHTVNTSEVVIFANANAGGFTVTLPDATTVTNKVFYIKKTDTSGNVVTLATTSSQTIDGVTTLALSTPYSVRTVISDGSNWQIL